MTSWQGHLANTALRIAVRPTWRDDVRVSAVRRRGARFDRVVARRSFAEAPVDAGGVPVTWVGAGDRTLLYLHGGGFCLHLPHTYRAFLTRVSGLLSARVLLPDYRLAPEHPFPAGPEDCLAAYRWLVCGGVDPASMVLAGDSAGGYLVLSTLLAARDEGLPMPACGVLMSGGFDLAFDDPSFRVNRRRDAMFRSAAFAFIRRSFAPEHDPVDPAVSPLRAAAAGLPPLLFQVGGTEMLLDQSVRAAAWARAAGVPATLEVYRGVPHVFQALPGLPEGRRALASVADFVAAHTRRPTVGSNRTESSE